MTFNLEKYVFFKKNARFTIIPKLDDDDETFNQFNIFLCSFKQFFWTCDAKYITVNDNNLTEKDIFNQLLSITFWLFNKKYRLKGSFYCWINNVIEYIHMDGLSKNIEHIILYDDIRIPYSIMNPCKLNKLGNYIINHVESKIFIFIQSKQNKNKYRLLNSDMKYNLTNCTTFFDQKNRLVKNRIDFLNKIKKCFCFALKIIGLFIVAPLFVYDKLLSW